MERTNQQQLLAGLQELKVVHDRHQDVLNTYKDLENTLRELQVRGSFCYCTADTFNIIVYVDCLRGCSQSLRLTWQGTPSSLQTHISVGGGVMMQAEVHDTSRVFVDVGLGFKVECSIEDGLRISGLRQAAAQVSASRTPCNVMKILEHLEIVPFFMLVHASPQRLHSLLAQGLVITVSCMLQEQMNACAMEAAKIRATKQWGLAMAGQ